MILIVVGTDPDLEREVARYLEARSVQVHEHAAGRPFSRLLGALDPARHHAIRGAVDAADWDRAAERGARLLFLGDPAGAPPTLATLATRAHHRLRKDEPDLPARLREIVVGAMSDFARPSWDEYFMAIARMAARRSNCIKRQVAAVIVRDQRIVSTGYNGTPRGARNCNEGGCERCNALAPAGTDLDGCICNHAEENAIAQAAYHGIAVKDGTIYCTFSPCLRCTKLLINAGIAEVVYDARYPLGDRALALLDECGVRHRRLRPTD